MLIYKGECFIPRIIWIVDIPFKTKLVSCKICKNENPQT